MVRNEVVSGVDHQHDDVGFELERHTLQAMIVLLRAGPDDAEIDRLRVGAAALGPPLLDECRQRPVDEVSLQEAVSDEDRPEADVGGTFDGSLAVPDGPIVVLRESSGESLRTSSMVRFNASAGAGRMSRAGQVGTEKPAMNSEPTKVTPIRTRP